MWFELRFYLIGVKLIKKLQVFEKLIYLVCFIIIFLIFKNLKNLFFKVIYLFRDKLLLKKLLSKKKEIKLNKA